MSRPVGRHREGGRPPGFTSRRFARAKKAAAAQLDQLEPAWVVMYGEGTRQFVAFARWAAEPVCIAVSGAEELRHLMREAEGLVAALAAQDAIAHTNGYATG
ncbi:hypothetical protein [Sphaerisporangium sp. TRM90804]|uniref:hypothetical protein n=1 Tax=Sphaerisporangium sp. TRM90804 TaxID=3031113 RepID=UPI0024484783|nr:hypothetical protein [Sphaerisporangium sp. TRM90804]MDH2425400.1 hypothetical protein [Sphaerisporangium sp. TRM90804]